MAPRFDSIRRRQFFVYTCIAVFPISDHWIVAEWRTPIHSTCLLTLSAVNYQQNLRSHQTPTKACDLFQADILAVVYSRSSTLMHQSFNWQRLFYQRVPPFLYYLHKTRLQQFLLNFYWNVYYIHLDALSSLGACF